MTRVLLAGCLCLTAMFAYADDADDILHVLESYKTAVLSDRGELAYTLVDENTRRYYVKLLQRSKSSTREQLAKSTLTDHMTIMMIRHNVPHVQINAMDGKRLFVYAVNQGWTGKSGILNLEFGTPKINFASASVPLLSEGRETSIAFDVYREADDWKIDLTSILKWGELAFRDVQERSGVSKEDIIITLIEQTSSKAVDRETIYNPIDPEMKALTQNEDVEQQLGEVLTVYPKCFCRKGRSSSGYTG